MDIELATKARSRCVHYWLVGQTPLKIAAIVTDFIRSQISDKSRRSNRVLGRSCTDQPSGLPCPDLVSSLAVTCGDLPCSDLCPDLTWPDLTRPDPPPPSTLIWTTWPATSCWCVRTPSSTTRSHLWSTRTVSSWSGCTIRPDVTQSSYWPSRPATITVSSVRPGDHYWRWLD